MNEHLYRSRDDRMLAGVAGGLAEIWDVDPSIVRVVWALLVILTGGIALLVYIVMAIVVPEEYGRAADAGRPSAAPGPAPSPYVPGWVPPGSTPAAPGPRGRARSDGGRARPGRAAPGATCATAPIDRLEARRAARAARRAARGDRGNGSAGIVIGGLLVVIGGAFFARELVPAFDFDLFWPLILVGLGVVLLVSGFTRDTRRRPGAHLVNAARRGSVIAATWLIGLGLVFLVQRSMGWSWGEAWPLFVILGGVAGLVSTLFRRRPGLAGIWSFTWPVAWTGSGIVLLLSTTGQLGKGPGETINEYWPWVAIVVGAWFLVGAVLPVGGGADGAARPAPGRNRRCQRPHPVRRR